MTPTPELDIQTIQKYYPNLNIGLQNEINKRAHTIMGCIVSPQLIAVKRYEGSHSTDKKDSKIVLPISIYAQFGSNNGLSEGVILSGSHKGKRSEIKGREQGIIALSYEFDKNLPEVDRIRSLFLHNMKSLQILTLEDQNAILNNNEINNIDELMQLIRNSINYKSIHSNNIYHLLGETQFFKK